MGVVDPGIRRPGQLDEADPKGGIDPIGRRPAPIAVGERRRPVGVADDQAVDLPGREPEDLRRLVERQAAGDDVVENVRAVLTPHVRIPLQSDHPFRSNPISCSGVFDHPEGEASRAVGVR
jgi:hypothetical protein